MELEKNLLLAKKYMVDNIYNAINVEGIAMTFPETQTICEGLSVAGKSIDDINAVCDMKKAYQWVLENIDEDINIDTIKNINRILGKYTVINSGHVRDKYDEPIRVMVNGGKYYYPDLPSSEDCLDNEITSIMNDKTEGLDRYFELFCYLCKKQLFNDGNKRTATLTVNMAMIQAGDGLFTVPSVDKVEFYEKLALYYENDDNKEMLKTFLREKCVSYTEPSVPTRKGR